MVRHYAVESVYLTHAADRAETPGIIWLNPIFTMVFDIYILLPPYLQPQHTLSNQLNQPWLRHPGP
jgi:hypothetical protein